MLLSAAAVLDIAGGTGDLARQFSRIVGDKGRVVLADINEDDEISDQEINNAMMVLEKAKRLKTAKLQREAYSTFMNK